MRQLALLLCVLTAFSTSQLHAADDANGQIDVCSLLLDEDAQSIGEASRLASGGARYFVTREPVLYSGEVVVPLGRCRFNFSFETELGRAFSGSVVVVARPATWIEYTRAHAHAKPIENLGDEAYYLDSVIVRSGDVVLNSAENSFDPPFMIEVYRHMVARLGP